MLFSLVESESLENELYAIYTVGFLIASVLFDS